MTRPWKKWWSAVTLMTVALLVAGVGPRPARAAKRPVTPPPPITFSDIPWRTSGDSTLVLLTERGYTEVRGNGSAEMIVCQGRLYDHVAIVRAQLDEDRRLVRWWISVAAGPDEYREMRKVYDDIVTASVSKYGERWTWADRIRFPFEAGDGNEAEALRQGLATIRSEWRVVRGDALKVEMDRQVGVTLEYECQDWSRLQARIKAKKARDL